MRLGFYGGTFDPPHRGHLAVSRAAVERLRLDRLLMAPTFQQVLKAASPLAGFADRVGMVGALCEEENRRRGAEQLEVTELDGPRSDGAPNYTIESLRRLRQLGEASVQRLELFVVVGADSFLDLRRWREPDALLEIAEWVVVSRRGFSLADLSPLGQTDVQRQRVHLLQDVDEPISATGVRHGLECGEDVSALLTPAVQAYIERRGLYAARV